jgi:hypothetical protein
MALGEESHLAAFFSEPVRTLDRKMGVTTLIEENEVFWIENLIVTLVFFVFFLDFFWLFMVFFFKKT